MSVATTTKPFWTAQREQRLLMWYDRFQDHPKVYTKVAAKLKISKSAAYKKLGRMGQLNAPWTNRYR